MMDKERERSEFLRLSSILMGIAIRSVPISKAGDLDPRNSPIDLPTEYLNVLKVNIDTSTLETLFGKVATRNDDQLKVEVENILNDSVLGPICRSIMKLWLLGIWYSPLNPTVQSYVVSAQAYKEGLIWKLMQAHPSGYSNLPFGHWADSPPSLGSYVTLID